MTGRRQGEGDSELVLLRSGQSERSSSGCQPFPRCPTLTGLVIQPGPRRHAPQGHWSWRGGSKKGQGKSPTLHAPDTHYWTNPRGFRPKRLSAPFVGTYPKGGLGGLRKGSRNFLLVCHHWFKLSSCTGTLDFGPLWSPVRATPALCWAVVVTRVMQT